MTFLVTSLYVFYFRRFLRFPLSFLWSLLFDFSASLIVHKNENSRGLPVRIHLHGWRVSQLQRCPKRYGVEIETQIRSRKFVLHMANYHFSAMRISKNHSNSILVHFVGWLFDTPKPVASKLSYKHDVIIYCL